MNTATTLTRQHYRRPEVRDTILRLSGDGDNCRWGNGQGNLWYKYDQKKKYPLNLTNTKDYYFIMQKTRTMYWTLNIFNKKIFDIDYNKTAKGDSATLSKTYTEGYTLGIDIDKGPDCNIHDPDVKKAVEDMAKFFTDRLRQFAPNSVYVLYSGGGIYVLLHHNLLKPYFEKHKYTSDWFRALTVLLNAYDYAIGDMEIDFFRQHPQHINKVKADALNNAKRLFKNIFSVHKKLDYAVIPLDPNNINIDFEKAKLPLSADVIESGKDWYTQYDDGIPFLMNFIKTFYERSERDYSTKSHNNRPININTDISKLEIDIEYWPPCIKNMLQLKTGSTRGLALLAAFLGQMGVPTTEAKTIFFGLAQKWGAETSNIFESYFGKLKTPMCRRLRSDDNTGFPSGVSINNLNICKPVPRCLNCVSPRYFADKPANIERMLYNLQHDYAEESQ